MPLNKRFECAVVEKNEGAENKDARQASIKEAYLGRYKSKTKEL